MVFVLVGDCETFSCLTALVVSLYINRGKGIIDNGTFSAMRSILKRHDYGLYPIAALLKMYLKIKLSLSLNWLEIQNMYNYSYKCYYSEKKG